MNTTEPPTMGPAILVARVERLSKTYAAGPTVIAVLADVFIGGTNIVTLDDTELTLLRRRRFVFVFVFQSFNLVPSLDVSENVMLPFELDGRAPFGDEAAWIQEMMTSLGLYDRLRQRPHELSGGRQQGAAIANGLGSPFCGSGDRRHARHDVLRRDIELPTDRRDGAASRGGEV